MPICAPTSLRTVCAVPLVLAVAVLALGFLPERFEPAGPWSTRGSIPTRQERPTEPLRLTSESTLPAVSVGEQALANLIKHVVGGARPMTEQIEVAPPRSAVATPLIDPSPPRASSGSSSLSLRTTGEVAIQQTIAKAVSVFTDRATSPEPPAPAAVASPSSSSASVSASVSAESEASVSPRSLVEVASGVLDELNASSSVIVRNKSWLQRSTLARRSINTTAIEMLADRVSSRLSGTSLTLRGLRPTVASAEAVATRYALNALELIRSSTELVLSTLDRTLASLLQELEPLLDRVRGIVRCLARGSSTVATVAEHTVKRAQRGMRIQEAARRRALQAMFGEASRKAEEAIARTARVADDVGSVVEAAQVGVAKASRDLHVGGRRVVGKSSRGLQRAVRDVKGVVGGSKKTGPPPPSDGWTRQWIHRDGANSKATAQRTIDSQKGKKRDKAAVDTGCSTRAVSTPVALFLEAFSFADELCNVVLC